MGSKSSAKKKKESKEEKEARKAKRKLEKKEKKKKRRRDEDDDNDENIGKEENDAKRKNVSSSSKKKKSCPNPPLLGKAITPSKPTISKLSTSSPKSKESISNSPFYTKKLSLLISLLPSSLSNIVSNVSKSIRETLLLRYNDACDGILLAFENVEIVRKKSNNGEGEEKLGRILNEMPHVHFHVVLDALVFCPKVGMKLTGTVNESFPSHVGLLIHSFFNAMVSADQLRAVGYTFDRDAQEWVTERSRSNNGDDKDTLSIDDKVLFTVDKLHECAGIISLEGSKPTIVG